MVYHDIGQRACETEAIRGISHILGGAMVYPNVSACSRKEEPVGICAGAVGQVQVMKMAVGNSAARHIVTTALIKRAIAQPDFTTILQPNVVISWRREGAIGNIQPVYIERPERLSITGVYPHVVNDPISLDTWGRIVNLDAVIPHVLNI